MLHSFKKNKWGYLLMILSTFLVCFGQYFWKISKQNILFLLFGFLLYGLGAITMMIAYKFGKLSVLQPILSINYVLAVLIGVFLLNETIELYNILGIIMILIGVTLIVGGDLNDYT